MPRPKSFDPPVALASAMSVFWTKGFSAASIQNLTDKMGINRFSLYSTFGDKRELYMKSLDCYFETVVEPSLEPLTKPKQGLKAIENHLYRVIDGVYEGSKKGGVNCLLSRAATEKAPTDKIAADKVSKYRQHMHNTFATCLKNAKSSGELAADVKVTDAAWMLVSMHHGLIDMETASPDRKALRSAARLAVNGLRK